MSAERNVRDAAARLASALDDARAAGLVVTWPGSPAGLRGIAISATAKAAPDFQVEVTVDLSGLGKGLREADGDASVPAAPARKPPFRKATPAA